MKFSYAWLGEYVDLPAVSPDAVEQLANDLTSRRTESRRT